MEPEITEHLGMRFEAHPEKWYQKDRQKNSSGPIEWHSLTPELRQLSKAIAGFGRRKEKRNDHT